MTDMNDAINISELLKAFADNDYPITYPDGSHGRGMGYGDFEKLLNKISKGDDKNGNWNEDSRSQIQKHIDFMPPKCHDCPYWEMCEEPYICPTQDVEEET